ncbi:hypothetical protein KUTeg_023948 [Tegillarca granosa]|uniref:DUF4371 domain-containing protein n=1 Tax=Tegillarca granosa TaxID=220873 RepID=A0ABQ9E1J0_TEGGR|nr:hypothetical protein KUTeg_023948 [Tegillarca granosa]
MLTHGHRETSYDHQPRKAPEHNYSGGSQEDKQIFPYLKCAYYLAKEELPKDKFESILKLTRSLNSKLIIDGDGNLKYCSHAAVTEFQNAIGDVIIEDKISRIKSSHYFSLTVDESTDIGNKKRLLMYISYLENHQVKTELFDNIQISSSSANAEIITDKIVNSLCEKGTDISKMVANGTDSASVMTGKKSGVCC